MRKKQDTTLVVSTQQPAPPLNRLRDEFIAAADLARLPSVFREEPWKVGNHMDVFGQFWNGIKFRVRIAPEAGGDFLVYDILDGP